MEAGRWGRGRLGDGHRKMLGKRDGRLGPHPTPTGFRSERREGARATGLLSIPPRFLEEGQATDG